MQRFVQQAESSDLEIRKVIRPTETQYSLIDFNHISLISINFNSFSNGQTGLTFCQNSEMLSYERTILSNTHFFTHLYFLVDIAITCLGIIFRNFLKI